jgi:hypothetical protein
MKPQASDTGYSFTRPLRNLSFLLGAAKNAHRSLWRLPHSGNNTDSLSDHLEAARFLR